MLKCSRRALRFGRIIFVSGAAVQVKKPAPLPTGDSKPLRVCPVCGAVSYSLAGVHPQCAQEQADARRVARIKRENKPTKTDRSSKLAAWEKRCPKCQTRLHVRKRTCECGYRFS